MSGSATTVRWLLRESLLDELNVLHAQARAAFHSRSSASSEGGWLPTACCTGRLLLGFHGTHGRRFPSPQQVSPNRCRGSLSLQCVARGSVLSCEVQREYARGIHSVCLCPFI
jgi:hypothetical protein